ncbi:TonB-dependent receptor plug domain-containing protein [Roseateles sp. BYS180W]|uniref:TonB-dependent receptor plug domain-containing protein n=1 Tax=Roseateles rivi TaxID=3299028 RepID=A0ABW7FUW7_9BURK
MTAQAQSEQQLGQNPQTGKLQLLDKVVVTGSHLRSLVGEQGAQPVLTLTRQDIERSGATTLADLATLVPQLGVGSAGVNNGNSSGSTPDGRQLFDLRGFGSANTLVLVDGRRLPRSGQRSGGEGYESTGIPLSAIERVEILLSGGSAVYGADAVGGVINLITRKSYSGTELEAAYDNTFNKDASNGRISLAHGMRQGAFSLRAMGTYEDQNALARRDRGWLRSDDRREFGGANGLTRTLPVGGRVRSTNGRNLPGLNTSVAYIPANSTGQNLTVADYAGAAATPQYDRGQTLNAINDARRSSMSLDATWQHGPGLELYGSFAARWVENSAPTDPITVTSLRLPANYPGNPFKTTVIVDKYFWELGQPERLYRYRTRDAVVGARGELSHEWVYDLQLAQAYSRSTINSSLARLDSTALSKEFAATPPLLVLNDSWRGAAVNTPGRLEALVTEGQPYDDSQRSTTMQASANGPLWKLGSDSINLAVGLERRRETVSYTNLFSFTEALLPEEPRTITSAYAEVSVPLVSPKVGNSMSLLHALTLTGAVRHDRYSDFGQATKPALSLLAQPVRWISLRASHSSAYKVPELIDLRQGAFTDPVALPPSSDLLDPYRNNEAVTALVGTTKGNPALKPETSRHQNFGLVLESPWTALKGLSLSMDYWKSRVEDQVASLSDQERLYFFPEQFTRAALTAADVADGYKVGAITAVDRLPVNIAYFRTAGLDTRLRYRVRSSWGEWDAQLGLTQTRVYERVPFAGAAPSSNVTTATRPDRATASVSWQRAGLGSNLTMLWQGSYKVNATLAETYRPTRQFNAALWYDFGRGTLHTPDGALARGLGNSRITLGLINFTNERPQVLLPSNSSALGVSGAVDPRLARYTLTWKAAF